MTICRIPLSTAPDKASSAIRLRAVVNRRPMLAKECAQPQRGWQVWKAPAQGGAAIQVTHHGGVEAFESLDGMFVYYAKRESDGIWRVPVQGGEETQVLN